MDMDNEIVLTSQPGKRKAFTYASKSGNGSVLTRRRSCGCTTRSMREYEMDEAVVQELNTFEESNQSKSARAQAERYT